MYLYTCKIENNNRFIFYELFLLLSISIIIDLSYLVPIRMSVSSSIGLEEGSEFGTNSYEKKMRLIEESKNDSLTLDDMNDLGSLLSKALTEDLPKVAKATAGNIAKTLLPGFLKRMQKRKIHTQQIQEIEKFVKYFFNM